MKRTQFRPFFLELLLTALFSFILIAIILQMLANARFLREDTALLNQAVSACEEAASSFSESGGSFEQLYEHYPTGIAMNNQIIVYYSKDFLYCNREAASYYLLIEDNYDDTINIYFYEKDKAVIYSIERSVIKSEVRAS